MKDRVKAAYQELAESYNAHIDTKPHNAYYDRPNTLALMGEVRGNVILDAACGPGKYAEILIEQGARVVGFDISPNMVALARKRVGRNANFFVHDLAKPLKPVKDSSIDKVLVALAMHYVKDWNPVVKEFHRVLKPKGEVIFSIEHPFFDYNYFNSSNYFDIEAVEAEWKGFGINVTVPCYRRSLQECLSPFTESGFYIDKLVEPLPTEEFKKHDPKHYKELLEFPAFMCIRAIKK